jgi:hypothetical protein
MRRVKKATVLFSMATVLLLHDVGLKADNTGSGDTVLVESINLAKRRCVLVENNGYDTNK